MLEPINKWLKRNSPALHGYLRARFFHPVERLNIELRMLRSGALRGILLRKVRRCFGFGDKMSAGVPDGLPVQSCLRQDLTQQLLGVFPSNDAQPPDLPHWLTVGGSPQQGTHTVLLRRSLHEELTLQQQIVNQLLSYYPSESALKLVRRSGGVSADYLTTEVPALLDALGTPTPLEQLLIANVLFLSGVGPRVWDLFEIQIQDNRWAAFVVEDVGVLPPTQEQCEQGLEALKCLVQEGVIAPVMPEGFQHKDFKPPACNGNAFVKDGRFYYVDFQSFAVHRYLPWLTRLAERAASVSHFGSESLFRGGRYLYQEVPGVPSFSKRTRGPREALLQRFFKDFQISLHDRVVLDIGCNIGMMIGFYLRCGAYWCHGWDRPHVIEQTEAVLLAVGCTRFSLSSGELVHDYALGRDLPPHLVSRTPKCVISYLSVRRHIGWLQALTEIDWEYLIYEAHEGEDMDHLLSEVENLNLLLRARGRSAEILNRATLSTDCVEDGDSRPRFIALLKSSTRSP